MNDKIIAYCGNVFAVIMTAIQTNNIFQTIQLVLTILSIIITIAYTVWKWYRKAKEDDKISEDEIDELIDIGKKGIKDIKEELEKKNKEE